jgi:hypothetical protein
MIKILTLQTLISLLFFCLIYSATIFSLFNLCLCILLFVFYILVLLNLKLYAFILLFVELHVFYIVLCIIFSELQYDTQAQFFIKNSQALLINKFILLVCFGFGYSFITYFLFKLNILNTTVFTNLFFINALNNFNTYFNVTSSILEIAFQNLTVLLIFEFFILNLLMFFVIICFACIKLFLKKDIIKQHFYNFKTYSASLLFNNLYMRFQNFFMQTLTQPTNKSISNKKFNLKKFYKMFRKNRI